jgi:hypothetical protein
MVCEVREWREGGFKRGREESAGVRGRGRADYSRVGLGFGWLIGVVDDRRLFSAKTYQSGVFTT